MADAAGGLPPPLRSYRDAVAGATVSPPPPPISFDSASFRPMGTLTRDQGMKWAQRALDDRRRDKSVAFAEHVTCPHPGASTSGAKEDGKEMCGDVLYKDTPEPVMEEVVHTPEIVTGGMEGPDHVPPTPTSGVGVEDMSKSGMESTVPGPMIAPSRDPEEPAPGPEAQGSGDPIEMSTDVQQAGGHVPVASTADPTREELPRCGENKSVWDMPYSTHDIEDDVFTQIGAGRVQTDDDDVSRRVARHRRGRSMEDDPSGDSTSLNFGQAASPPRRRVTRSTARSTLRY
ncbi:hypothetical protein Salat_2889200 [Sesamum alatum]|uniref:Uncharacterized protein n=1 Tax=Sesamum alatum TaxID=300844 RepID=A0AAE1XJ99_9LAMI|nr:hypothetical protein Salat_2889200 [Sesamum alatum]